jgi:Heterokaryon incompatibility protein (HET)
MEFQFSNEEWASIRTRAGRMPYAPLREREFRVLLLYPWKDSDRIVCQIVRQDLDHIVLGYVALSYTWGDASKTAVIDCLMDDREPAHGRHHPKPEDVCLSKLTVTENAVAALRRFRHREFISAIWMDAICIDQQNLDERNQQVRIMPEIYMRAEKTAIWLGQSSEVSGAGLALVDKLFDAPRYDGTAVLFEELTPENASSRAHWEGIADILRRPWFTRVWVRQELVFSRNPGLVCGEDTLAWEKFQAVIPGLLATQLGFADGTAPHYGLHHTRLLQLMQAMVRRPGWMETMLEKELLVMLWFCRECGATDPRDKVISVLGLCSPVQQSLLPRLDYSFARRVGQPGDLPEPQCPEPCGLERPTELQAFVAVVGTRLECPMGRERHRYAAAGPCLSRGERYETRPGIRSAPA